MTILPGAESGARSAPGGGAPGAVRLKVMILAAGRGERMRPLSDRIPKPLLPAAGKPLLVHLIESLACAGLCELVVNYAHLGRQIADYLGNGSQWGVRIAYSPEPAGGLETGGGIYQALPLLDSDPFMVVNGDIWTDYPFINLPKTLTGLAHLVLVDNPPHHPHGDFCLKGERVEAGGVPRQTFSGIGVYSRRLFEQCAPGRFPLAPVLRAAMERGQVSGEHYKGRWRDVGSPERLAELDRELMGSKRQP